MKNLIFLLLFLIIYHSNSQSISIENVDIQDFPEIELEVQSYDVQGSQFRSLSQMNTQITDSGNNKLIKEIECDNEAKFSIIFQLDFSASMGLYVDSENQAPVGERRWDAVINSLNTFIDELDLDKYEISFMRFSSSSEIVQPFSSDITELKSTLNELLEMQLFVATDFNAALIGLDLNGSFRGEGALQQSKNSKWNPIVFVVTDGEHSRQLMMMLE